MRARPDRSLSASTRSKSFVGVILACCAATDCASSHRGTGSGAAGTSFDGTGGTGGVSASASAGTGGTTGSAGASATSGTTGYAGTTGTGGSTTGGIAGSGSVPTGPGGSVGRGGGGASGMGGTSTDVGQSGTSTAGTATGGAGTAGAGGATKAPPVPSAGCGMTNPQVGTSTSPLTVAGHKYYVKLPIGYEGSKPFPLLFVFNPTGNPITWAEQSAGYETNGAKTGALRVYPDPASEASGWVASDVPFFMPLYDQLTSNFCIDKTRVFAAGESSGGDFSSILGCEYAKVLRAVAPCSTKEVSAYPLDVTMRKCTGEVTPIVIQGKNDSVVGPANGPKTRDFYLAVNHCRTTSVPVAGYTDTLSNCVQYQGCDDGFPVYWCQHTDPNYSNTNHGWPAFAASFTWEVFSSY